MKLRIVPVLCMLAALPFAACQNETSTPAAQVAPVSQYFPLRVGDATLQVQVPIARSEQAQGLMHRTDLADDQGMLFSYKQPQEMDFWMENTPIPLDIGFFDRAGVLREVRSMLPYDRTTIRSASQDLQYALEVNKGWFTRHKVLPGAKLDKTQLAHALKARGEDPADYGLAK